VKNEIGHLSPHRSHTLDVGSCMVGRFVTVLARSSAFPLQLIPSAVSNNHHHQLQRPPSSALFMV
jgi:hypothetical protein